MAQSLRRAGSPRRCESHPHSAVKTLLWWLLSSLLLAIPIEAQYPPPISKDNVTTVRSPVDGNITVTFKTPSIGTCTTVFSTQKQYSGYINLPSSTTGQNYTVNMFFWFFEARSTPETAPLTIYINGGPGSSSMVGLFQEVGPCQVVEIDKAELGTQAREWGWDRSSNIIFIDQPVQVGFSYDVLTNASLNLIDDVLSYPATPKPITQPSYTFLNGTFASGNSNNSASTSEVAAQAVWHFLQAFLGVFPQYNPAISPAGDIVSGTTGINLFTESYGGKYGPAIASFFKSQNALRQTDPTTLSSTLELTLATLGIFNGWIDLFTQTPYYPRFAFNNTYGISAISEVQELNALSAYSGANGCEQLTLTCRAQEATNDPADSGNVTTVDNICSQAQQYCETNVVDPYTLSERSAYDISQNYLDPFPNNHYLEYLNQASVQQAIGAPVNYTQDSQAVSNAFSASGDYARDEILHDLINLVDSGVRVALIYGDRDYVCNWFGGEAISFAVAGALPQYGGWYQSGYTPVVANSSYVGGVVREFANLSFTRVYDAGHLVPAYQPETAFTIFTRIIEGTEIGLGTEVDVSTFGSTGSANATHTNSAPPMASPTCFVRAANSTCDVDQKNMLANGAGVIINGVLYSNADDWISPPASISTEAGMPGTPPASMMTSAPESSSKLSGSVSEQSPPKTTSLPTGVYTATSVPSMTTTTSKNEAETNTPGLPNIHWLLCLGLLSYSLPYS